MLSLAVRAEKMDLVIKLIKAGAQCTLKTPDGTNSILSLQKNKMFLFFFVQENPPIWANSSIHSLSHFRRTSSRRLQEE